MKTPMDRVQRIVEARPSPTESEHLRKLVQRFVRSFGLLVTRETPCGHPVSPSHAHALMVLLERSGAPALMSQAELGKELGIDKSNVARLCGRLEEAGHASQEQAPGDGRSRLLKLTAAGKRLAQRIEQASHERFERIIAGLARGKRETIFESLAALNLAIEALRDGEES